MLYNTTTTVKLSLNKLQPWTDDGGGSDYSHVTAPEPNARDYDDGQ